MASFGGLEQLRAAVIDGRTENVRYRQDELQSLHAILRNNADKILSAISEDTQDASQEINLEAKAEFYLAMNATKRLYHSLNFEQSLKDEYQLANGSDNPNRRVGWGLVIVRPTRHTRFYSIISPLATAITAGNCTCLELESTMLNVDRVLKDLLLQALDPDTFYISSATLKDSSILASALLIDQTSTTSTPALNQLVSNSSARTIAVVDRAADIDLAAKAIVTARFSFQGTSPYSPDLVIVNDFAKSEYIEACTKYASKFFGSSTKAKRAQNNDTSATKEAFSKAESAGQISVFGSSNFLIADVHERTSPIAKLKISGRYLPIVECTSLVDSVLLQSSKSDLLAVYLFTDAPSAKFLAQHFNARATYVNQIPIHLLLGPAAPLTPHSIPAYKYSIEMFSSERPQYVKPPTEDLLWIDEILVTSQQSKSMAAVLKKIQSSAVEPLPKTGQGLGHAIGFFEQGILLGAVLFFSAVIPTLGYGSWVLGTHAWRLTQSWKA